MEKFCSSHLSERTGDQCQADPCSSYSIGVFPIVIKCCKQSSKSGLKRKRKQYINPWQAGQNCLRLPQLQAESLRTHESTLLWAVSFASNYLMAFHHTRCPETVTRCSQGFELTQTGIQSPLCCRWRLARSPGPSGTAGWPAMGNTPLRETGARQGAVRQTKSKFKRSRVS